MISKILLFDHSLPDASDEEFVVGIAYEEGYRLSYTARDRTIEAIDRMTHLAGRPCRWVALNMRNRGHNRVTVSESIVPSDRFTILYKYFTIS